MMRFLRGLFGRRPEEEQQDVDVLADAQARAQQHPRDTTAHFDLGSIYYVRGNLEDAVKELERAIELAPDHADASYMLGLAFAKLGRYDDARRAFEAAGKTTDNPMLQNYVHQKLQELEDKSGHEQS